MGTDPRVHIVTHRKLGEKMLTARARGWERPPSFLGAGSEVLQSWPKSSVAAAVPGWSTHYLAESDSWYSRLLS